MLFHCSWLVGFMVFNATFNNISAISWRSVLLAEETRLSRENHRPTALHHCRRVGFIRGGVLVLNQTYFQSYTESNVNDLTASGGEPLGFLTSIRPWSTVISTILQYIRVHLKLKNACLISWSPLNSYICTQVIIVVS